MRKPYRSTASLFMTGLVFCGLFMVSCGDKPSTVTKGPAPDETKLKNQFIKANQQVIQKENDEMDVFVKNHRLNFVKTGLGIRYYVYQPSAKGDSIRDGDLVTMNYTLSLLDGTECYSSAQDGAPKEFKVGEENLESGIHRGVQFLKGGDKALLLIPSHLAHGLLGDMKKIPPQRVIVYEVEILKVQKGTTP